VANNQYYGITDVTFQGHYGITDVPLPTGGAYGAITDIPIPDTKVRYGITDISIPAGALEYYGQTDILIGTANSYYGLTNIPVSKSNKFSAVTSVVIGVSSFDSAQTNIYINAIDSKSFAAVTDVTVKLNVNFKKGRTNVIVVPPTENVKRFSQLHESSWTYLEDDMVSRDTGLIRSLY